MHIVRTALLTTALLSGATRPVDVWGVNSEFSFEPNSGQIDRDVRYFARTSSCVVFFTDSEVVLGGTSGAVRFELAGGDEHAPWRPTDATGATTSYYVGRDPRAWVEAVPHYRRLARTNVYPGIDVLYYGNASRLEYDFVVAPGADPSRIRVRIKGARSLSIASDGSLQIEAPDGRMVEHKPVVYQFAADGSGRKIEGAFRLLGNHVGFALGKYDRRAPLWIDPVLVSSTYLGGNSDDKVVAADGKGNSVGTTSSIDFPGASFARRKGADVFVQTGGQTLVFGGSGDDQVTSVDFGNPTAQYSGLPLPILIGGYTNSTDLPTNFVNPFTLQANNPWQRDFAGGATDGFILIVGNISRSSNTFGIPGYATYVGTAGDDQITAVVNQMSSGGGSFALAGTTNGAGLAQASASAMQPAPAGGLDGFVMTAFAYPFAGGSIVASTYFGGSGDDIPSSMVASGGNFYLAGTTTSPDFPLMNPLYSQRTGDSDAFLIEIAYMSGGWTLLGSTLFGGSGTDRGIGVAMSTPYDIPSVVLAGVTSSRDLPLLNAVQPAYGGGSSDAFLAQFTRDLSQLISCTYIGGSGTDEPTSVAADVLGNIFLAGWTSSSDFPVRNAFQSTYGGGPDDGFLVHFDPDGTVQQATYFGGSQSDRILNVVAGNDLTAWIAGQTTSPDLPLQNPAQGVLKGSSDGFIAGLSTNVIQTSDAIGGKDMRVAVSIYSGNGPTASSAQLTVTSSDPSKVLLAANLSDPGQSSIQTLLVGPYRTIFGSAQSVYMDCLDSQGGADLTFSAPGYPDKIVRAKCFETHVATSVNSMTTQLYSPFDILVYLFAYDPSSTLKYGIGSSLRPDASPITVQIGNTNPGVGTTSVNSVTFDSKTSQGLVLFTPTGIGQTDVVFSSPSLRAGPFDTFHVTVTPAVQFVNNNVVIPGGLQLFLGLSKGQYLDPANVITATSQDPAKLVLSTDPSVPGTASIAIKQGTGFYAQALASSGDVPVTVSMTGADDVSTIAHLSTPVARLSPSSPPPYMSVGDISSAQVQIGAAGDTPYFANYLHVPGSPPVQFTLNTSDPSVVSIPAATVPLSEVRTGVSIAVQAVGEGSATLTLQPADGVALSNPTAVPVKVTKRPLRLPDADVGKDLVGQMTITLPQAASGSLSINLTSSDPSLVLLSPDRQSTGRKQITLPVTTYSSTATFYIYGLAASGQATVSADVPGFGSVSATVQLDPSGFGWSQDSYSTVLYAGGAFLPAISAFAIDPATMLPVGTQTLRPGVSATVNIVNLNPDLLSLVTSSVSFDSSTNPSPIGITSRASGKATLQISQPPGFTAPSIRQQLPVNIAQPAMQLSSISIGKDAQAPVQFSFSGAPVTSSPLTITSSDPSKLLVSSDPTVTGSASVTVPAGGNRPQIYLQALDSQGTVTITASEPTYNDSTATVTLVPLAVSLGVDNTFNGGSTAVSGGYSTTLQSPNTHIRLQLFAAMGSSSGGIVQFRPGVAAPQVQVISSQTGVGQIIGSPVLVTDGYGQNTVDFQPIGAGQTDVSVVPPPGFAPSSKLTFFVSAPTFITSNYLMGKDTAVTPGIGIPQNVKPPATNVTVTLTSGDPSRVLLSRDANSTPGPSITSTLIAGQTNVAGIMIHALTNNGIVPVKVTAPGFTDTSFNIALTDLLFGFNNPATAANPTTALLQAGPQQMQIWSSVAFPKDLPQGYVTQGYGGNIRPGADIVVTLASSDSGIVAIDKPQVEFTGGSSYQSFTYRPVSVGQATFSLTPPAGYVSHPTQATAAINIDAATITIQYYGSGPLGRDLQTNSQLGTNLSYPFSRPIPITITSSDPSRLLVAPDSSTPGQASITTTLSSPVGQVYFQSLSDNGSVSVTASSDGFHSASQTITLAPSAALFQAAPVTQNIYTNSGVQHFGVGIATLDSTTLRPLPFSAQLVRPGTTLSVNVTASDNSVVTVNPSILQFTSANSLPQIQVQPLSAGTAIVSIGQLPGGVTPASGQQLVLNVSEPEIAIPDFSLGHDLEVPMVVTLSSHLPAPGADLPVNVCSYGLLGVASDPVTNSLNQCVSTVVPAGQHVSKTFYVSTHFSTGTGSLQVSSPSRYGPFDSNVFITETAFIFQVQQVSIAHGSNFTLNVAPALYPLTTQAIAPPMISPGTPPIAVNVVSSDPKIVAVVNSPILFKPGDQQAVVNLQALAPGSATLRLSGATYQFGTSQSTIEVQVK